MDINVFKLKNLGINTYKEAVLYLREDCHVCRSEGFEAHARIFIQHKNRTIQATLNTVVTDLLKHNEASLSTYAFEQLNAQVGDEIRISHPKPLTSLNYIRAKIFGKTLDQKQYDEIIRDLVAGYISDIHISAFLAASSNGRLAEDEIMYLTKSMIDVGSKLNWDADLVVDKHCVGGLPGNRTSLIVVPIVTAFGLTMPKTSSRAITSPAGTADTMEVIAPVNLNLEQMRKVVEQENGCIVWGGAVALSPADDLLIRIERTLLLDSEGQLVASILSKKIAAGSSHIFIDIPIGPTAKVRNIQSANAIRNHLEYIGKKLGVVVKAMFSDGTQPIGRGIGPALEAKDVLSVLQNLSNAPQDLKDRALSLAGHILEFSTKVKKGTGLEIATQILESGQAWRKFQAICQAQGGMREVPAAKFTFTVEAQTAGIVSSIDNRYISRLAKLAGAPSSKTAGVELLTPVGTQVTVNQPLYIIHAQTKNQLDYAISSISQVPEILQIREL